MTKKKDKNPFRVERTTETGERFVGGYFPRQLANYLYLIALHNEITISNTLRSIITTWMKNKQPEDVLIKNLSHRAVGEWKRRLENSKGKNGWKTQVDLTVKYIEYKKELRDILIKRKINEETIDKIILGMDEFYELGEVL